MKNIKFADATINSSMYVNNLTLKKAYPWGTPQILK